jgi:hypothetical protein
LRRDIVLVLNFPLQLEEPAAGEAGAAIPSASITIGFEHDELGRERGSADMG